MIQIMKDRAMKHYLLFVLLIALLASCAPQVTSGPFAEPAAQQAETAARIAYHRMELGLLETGSYTTNALVDLDLPKGVRWVLEDFVGDSYSLLFTVDSVPGIAWRVTPSGVRRITLRG